MARSMATILAMTLFFVENHFKKQKTKNKSLTQQQESMDGSLHKSFNVHYQQKLEHVVLDIQQQ